MFAEAAMVGISAFALSKATVVTEKPILNFTGSL
jgi:hypothetical protein